MKIITSLVLVAAFAGCEQQQSKLDSVTSKDKPADQAQPAPAAAPPAPTKINKSGTVEERLSRLEDAYSRSAEALDYITNAFAQQKAQQKAQQEQAERDEPAPDAIFALNIAEDVKGGQVDGPATAPITLVKAFDFACPYCQKTSGTMEELVKDYGGKVRVVYANFLIHPVARPAHLASCAAGKQGKYMAFKDAFWDKGFGPYAQSGGREQSSLGEANILTIAQGVGINVDKLKADMSSPECEARLKNDQTQMETFHVNATPTFYINGKHYKGNPSKEAFKAAIDEELKAVEKSGVPAADYYEKVVIAKGEKKFRSKMDPKP
jgi:protein-disulfide isomerase